MCCASKFGCRIWTPLFSESDNGELEMLLAFAAVEHVSGDMFKSVPSGDAIFMKVCVHSTISHFLHGCVQGLNKWITEIRDGRTCLQGLVCYSNVEVNYLKYCDWHL